MGATLWTEVSSSRAGARGLRGGGDEHAEGVILARGGEGGRNADLDRWLRLISARVDGGPQGP
jgi:hypothetical protein